MTAWIGRARLTIYLEGANSLKDKRSEVKRVVHRLQNRFNAAVAEIEDLDDIGVATIGIVVLSTSATHADQMLATILKAAEELLDLGVPGEIDTELLPWRFVDRSSDGRTPPAMRRACRAAASPPAFPQLGWPHRADPATSR